MKVQLDDLKGVDRDLFRVLFRSLGRTSDIQKTHEVRGDEALLEAVKVGLSKGYHVTVRYAGVR